MEHNQSGEQDDSRDPEVDIGEDHGPDVSWFLRTVFGSHVFIPSMQRSGLWLELDLELLTILHDWCFS